MKISYEILTKVKKTYHHKSLRAYVFSAQIIIKEMTPLNFRQLNLPVKGTIAVFSIQEHIAVNTSLTATALKTAITKRMTAEKKRFEKILQPEKEVVLLTATGSYKNTLSTIEDLSK